MNIARRAPQSRRSRRRASSRRSTIRPWMLWSGAAVVASTVAVGGLVVANQAMEAKDRLEAAVPLLTEVQAQLASADSPERAELVKRLESQTSAARAATSGAFWWMGEQIPALGNNLLAVRTAAEVADDVVGDVLVPAAGLSLDRLKPTDGRVPVERVAEFAETASGAIGSLERAAGRIKRLPTLGLLPPVQDALATITVPLRDAAALASGARPLIDALPEMLGAEGVRDYVIMFQNPAELRALGGIPGASVLLRVADGRMELVQTAAGGQFVTSAEPVVPLPADASALYREVGGGIPTVGANYLETTSRPDFSYAGRTASAFWQNSYGVNPSAVFSVDPVALSYFLAATGPVQVDGGQVLSAENVVSQLLNQVYRDNPGLTNEANQAQDAFFAGVVGAVFERLTAGELDLAAAADAWTAAAEERRLLLWSADPAEQLAIVDAGLGGLPPASNGTVNAFGLYYGDAVGSKLDYYLRDRVSVADGVCDARGNRSVRISTELSNIISGEPDFQSEDFDYITGFWEREGLPQGAIRLRVMLYAPEGAEITAATFGGEPVEFVAASDDGAPVAYVMVTVLPGEVKTLAFDTAVHHSATKTSEVDVTPTVVPSEVSSTREECVGARGE